MDGEDGRWIEWEPGPVSRPYTLTGGRTRPRGDAFYALLDVVGRGEATADQASLGPEQIRILDLCRVPVTVADLASDVDLPLGVVRILLDDLAQESLIEVRTRAPRTRITDKQLLRQILDALHTLLLADSRAEVIACRVVARFVQRRSVSDGGVAVKSGRCTGARRSGAGARPACRQSAS